ncbi:hypothetical protein HZH68_010648 [Vespula germanica]|uniref:Uncharacterized protein n=1 Tax=Vespula germanica TaxID=30212 RepID=A0A834N3P2_VESGE|nr:hypothetical protein HZH68_010648 [Vespula germanica]
MDFAGRRQRQAALGPINLEFIAAIICLRIFEGCVEGKKDGTYGPSNDTLLALLKKEKKDEEDDEEEGEKLCETHARGQIVKFIRGHSSEW